MQNQRDMVNGLAIAALIAGIGAVAPANSQEYWQRADNLATEDYVKEPMPPGFRVEATELEGPVFADSRGLTLYKWQLKDLRNGDLGDRKDAASTCTDELQTVNTGLMSPYPGGLELPDLDTRPTCAAVWPPVLASEDSEPVGKWTIIEREDGSTQWAYDGFPLYTSVLDSQPGNVLGGTNLPEGNDGPAVRMPVGPPPNVPPTVTVTQLTTGRLIVNHEGYSVYSWDKDGPNKSNCDSACLQEWDPVLAPETAQPQGEWSVIERSPGMRQWTFREKPIYTHIADTRFRSFLGSDVPGWHNVFTQQVPAPPKEFTIQDTQIGHVLADARGMSIYVYNCGDDASDQLACDHPGSTQAYRLAICGGGDPEKCLETWPYVLAAKDAKSDSRIWSVMDIDPKTGHYAAPGQADALHVWAYRGRPVFNFIDDRQVGETRGDAWGEFYGDRNGYKAFWLRDDFLGNAGGGR
jgi:predicted lipoprotein with Yx(FWY)xxD motif